MAEIIIYYWPNIDLQAAIQLIVRELCMLTCWAILNSVLYMWHMLVYFLKYQPQREGVAENETILGKRE